MNPKTFTNESGEYMARVKEFDKQRGIRVIGRRWVTPLRVYKGGSGRQSIEFDDHGKKVIKENWPGAASFELYKRVA